jgi:hypothetical protein
MSRPEFHLMQPVLNEDRATMRYSCPICDRCVEDGPEGITIVHKGDQSAVHRGGSLRSIDHSMEQVSQPVPRLH